MWFSTPGADSATSAPRTRSYHGRRTIETSSHCQSGHVDLRTSLNASICPYVAGSAPATGWLSKARRLERQTNISCAFSTHTSLGTRNSIEEALSRGLSLKGRCPRRLDGWRANKEGSMPADLRQLLQRKNRVTRLHHNRGRVKYVLRPRRKSIVEYAMIFFKQPLELVAAATKRSNC